MSELYASFLKTISLWQYKLNATISSAIRSLDGENYIYSASLVLGIAFLYGLIHAAGPGHGKLVVAAFFTKGGNSYKDALKTGYLIALIHAFSAMALTFTLFFVVKKMIRQNFNEFSQTAVTLSALIIIAVGLYIVFSSFFGRHSHKESVKGKSLSAVAFSVGIVPCPGVMTITLFCLVLKQYLLAVLSAVAMSIGMGLTISAAGVLSVLFAKKTDSFIHTKGKWLEGISGILVLILGIFLLIGSLS